MGTPNEILEQVTCRFYAADLKKIRKQAKVLGLSFHAHLRSVVRQALSRTAKGFVR
jgi:hypothetical protein